MGNEQNKAKIHAIAQKLESLFDLTSTRAQQILFDIGNATRNEAQDIIDEKNIGDRGLLKASMDFRIDGNEKIQTVTVGAFGIIYARMVEYGGAMSLAQIRAMFASFRNRQGGANKEKNAGDPVVDVRAKTYRGRPFLGPAVERTAEEHKALLRTLLVKK